MKDSTFITRVELKNYKSIAVCDVELWPLMFLVGQNGSGKSNFLDAFRFVAESLRTSLDHALRDRGGINEVRRRSTGHPNNFELKFHFVLPSGSTGVYWFRIAARAQGGFVVQAEECTLSNSGFPSKTDYFRVEEGTVSGSLKTLPAASADRLYLVNASGLPEFRPIYDEFSKIGSYNLNPAVIRDLQPPDAGHLLFRDGSNISSVLARLGSGSKNRERIESYLAKVVPSVAGVDVRPMGPKETLEFRQLVAGAKHPWRFFAANMSDGTLRALGILVALFQSTNGKDRVPLVTIEEPEAALHPAAAGILRDALRDGSQTTQILVTSHSPDLLDDSSIESKSILAVLSDSGVSKIGPIDEVGRSAMRDKLYTAGELLRLDQLKPDPAFQELLPLPSQDES